MKRKITESNMDKFPRIRQQIWVYFNKYNNGFIFLEM